MSRPTHIRPNGDLAFPENWDDAVPLPDGYWEAVDFEDRKVGLFVAVDGLLQAKRDLGFVIPEGTAAAGGLLQIRDEGDMSNWTLLDKLCDRQILAGNGNVVAVGFRLADNSTATPVSYVEASGILLALGAYYLALLQASFAVKDLVTAAAAPSALDLVDITQGWPV